MLIDTIDKERNTAISKDLDYLYKHCLFAVVRVRDHKDYEFLDGCIQILSDITEGWDRVGSAIKRAPLLVNFYVTCTISSYQTRK